MATGEQPYDGGIHIGSVTGSFAIGDHNQVINHATPQVPRDPDQEKLLKAVRELRADLARLVGTRETEVLIGELVGAQEEIESTGRAGQGRLSRLRTAMQDAGTAIGMLASGVAVGQAVGALLGG